MNSVDYQAKALRTMADQEKIMLRISQLGPKMVQLDNGVRGLTNEVGELTEITKKCIEYGKGPVDKVHIMEEVGDCFWRLRQICDAVGLTFEECMHFNLAKLAKRYPNEYSDFLAQEENRDRDVERAALEGHDPGMPDPPVPNSYTGLVEPWLLPNENDESQGGICCQRATGKYCYEHDPVNYTMVAGKWVLKSKITAEQDGHGFGHMTEEQSHDLQAMEDGIKTPPLSVRQRTDTHSYNRKCRLCKVKSVHSSNQECICPDCWASHYSINKKAGG